MLSYLETRRWWALDSVSEGSKGTYRLAHLHSMCRRPGCKFQEDAGRAPMFGQVIIDEDNFQISQCLLTWPLHPSNHIMPVSKSCILLKIQHISCSYLALSLIPFAWNNCPRMAYACSSNHTWLGSGINHNKKHILSVLKLDEDAPGGTCLPVTVGVSPWKAVAGEHTKAESPEVSGPHKPAGSLKLFSAASWKCTFQICFLS